MKKNLFIISTALLMILACSLESLGITPSTEDPVEDSVTPSIALTLEEKDGALATSAAATFEANDNVVATSVAATLEASNNLATSVATTVEATEEVPPSNTTTPTLPPTMSPTLPAVGSSTPTASLTPIPTVTATPSASPAPMVSVSVGTNCRTGPGKTYNYIGDLRVGESAEVVGKKTSYNYWVIKNPDADGECWLWGEYATITGDTSNLQEYPVPTAPASNTSATPVATASTTLTTPIVGVSVDTNCRTGPGKVYESLGVLKVGEIAEIVGKKAYYNYWIIKNPDTNGECWLWGEYATVLGDTSNLQEYVLPSAPPPTSTTLTAPMVGVSVDTNCRTGPGKVYESIGVIKAGEIVEVVGKKAFYDYWIIKNPDANGECWLWGYYATVIGDTSNLQEYALPPAPPPTTTTSTAPIASVSVGTNCRTGPSVAYSIIGSLRVGEKAEVVGKKTSYNYWIIKNPDAIGNCWLWGYYATIFGDTSNLQEYIVPPIP